MENCEACGKLLADTYQASCGEHAGQFVCSGCLPEAQTARYPKFRHLEEVRVQRGETAKRNFNHQTEANNES